MKKKYKYNRGFKAMKENIEDTSFGMCPAPMGSNQAVDILISYLLGDDWYVTMPLSAGQCTACSVEQILDKYSKKWKKDWNYFKNHSENYGK